MQVDRDKLVNRLAGIFRDNSKTDVIIAGVTSKAVCVGCGHSDELKTANIATAYAMVSIPARATKHGHELEGMSDDAIRDYMRADVINYIAATIIDELLEDGK